MKYKDFYTELSEKKTIDIELFIQNWKKDNDKLYRYSCTLGNCGVYISKFIKDASLVGLSPMKKVFGNFKSDYPSFDKNDFTESEISDMVVCGYDSNNKDDRIKYARENNMLDDLKYVPHYWIEYSGKIIDLVAEEQFVTPKLSSDTNEKRYIK